MRIFGSHVYVVNTDVTRQKLDSCTFLGFYLKFASTTRVVVYYNPTTKKIGCSSHVYFDELNVGLNSSHKPKFGEQLIQKYPSTPDTTTFEIATSAIQTLPILQHPITTFKIILPKMNENCTIKFYDDEFYGLPYIRSIPSTSFIGKQLPKTALTQQYIIALENEEPIHATSASQNFQRLRKSHATKIITLQLSHREPTKPGTYEELRTKFDQMRPVIAKTNIPVDNLSKNTNILYTPTVEILTHSPTKPITPKNVIECFQPTNPQGVAVNQ